MSFSTTPPEGPVTLTANARTVLEKRYLVKDATGTPVEQPEDMFWRVATTVAEADRRYGASEGAVQALAEEFYFLMTQRRFEPNSPTLMNAGRPLGQLSACFVLPVDDALSNGQSGIYDTLRSMALIHQSGGGTGFSFPRLRPRGSMVRSTTGVASGPVSFMQLYDSSTDAVKQGGTRRGANMGILRVDHPDVMEFIACKEDLTKITNFNISVGITRKFMDAVKAGTSYDLVNPVTGEVTGQLDAREVWDKMILGAWRTGEPGVFFIDEANKYNPVPHLGAYEATNPCGEQPLLPYDVCNLGSINVGHYVVNGEMDWEAFRRDVHLSTHFLDNIIDVNKYPLPEITALAQRIRRIGLGVMGFADALVRMGIPYDSPEGVEMGRKVMQFLDVEGKKESERLAKERGAFPEWARSIWGPDETCARDEHGQRIRPMQLLRNCNVPTVAPTGTISTIPGCPQPGRRDDARRERGLREHRQGRGVVQRRAHGEDREDRHREARRGAGAGAEAVQHREQHLARVPHPHAGGVPAALRQRDLQDHELLARRDARGRAGHLRAGLRAQLQGRDRVPRRLARQPGAEHRCHEGGCRQA